MNFPMMKTCLMKSQLSQFLPTQTRNTPNFLPHLTTNTRACAPNNPPNRIPTKVTKPYNSSTKLQLLKYNKMLNKSHTTTDPKADSDHSSSSLRRCLAIGGAAASMVALIVMMDVGRAWALGPEGPLVEEFWENVRRYALYALTVSTGVIYTVVQPIVELLKNPISAVLVVIIIGGTFFIVSQILSAMVGVSDFSYDYAY